MSDNDQYWRAALGWIDAEHRMYEDKKFATDVDDKRSGDEWREIVYKYLYRATVLGLDNPLGRQAVGKAATTNVAYLESLLRVYGSLPAPGFTSGVIVSWKTDER